MVSVLAKKVSGTYIPDEMRPGALGWAQKSLRCGDLHPAMKAFCEAQAEHLDPSMALVDRIDGLIHGRVPVMVADHESTRVFRVDVGFILDPMTGCVVRV